jgi:hypothetical protein
MSKHKESELEALRNLAKEPLTEGQVMGGFFLSLGGILVGLCFFFWATIGATTLSPVNVDSARITMLCSGAALMGLGILCLEEMWREITRGDVA